MKVGILALQGDFSEHAQLLGDLGAHPILVRRPSHLGGLDAIVCPGGESTTMSMLLESSGLGDALACLLADGLPALGTCAGMILLGSEVVGGRPGQRCFGAIDISVRRNAFGTQADSFECDLSVAGVEGGPVRALFIRAPVVCRVGPGVEVLASVEGGSAQGPVVCRQGPVMVAAFHPECSGDPRLHELFLANVARGVG
ncbi:MAG: pyridoxal 5'-phosphate synthase glutaminase subunit PdxT [Acidimicrobiales bacterium]